MTPEQIADRIVEALLPYPEGESKYVGHSGALLVPRYYFRPGRRLCEQEIRATVLRVLKEAEG